MAQQALLSGDPAAFEALIVGMLDQDNDTRKAAEAVFEQMKEHPDVLTKQLLQALRRCVNPEHRSFGAIMMRKVLSKDDPPYITKLEAATLVMVKTELLNSLREDTQKTVVRKVCDTISEVASLVYEAPGWPEVIPFLLQCVQTQQPGLMEAALNIFATLAHYMTDVFRQDLPSLVAMLQTCLTNPDRDVQLGAMRAISGFLQALEEPAEREKFVHMIPGMLQVLAGALNGEDEASAQEVLEMFIEIAEANPRFLRKQLEGVVSAMLAVAAAEQLEDSTRQLAAEFLVTLCEARTKAPGMMRKLPNFVGQLFGTLMMFLLDIEDDPLWHQADNSDHEEEGGGDRYEFGQECLDRIAVSLGGNSLVPPAGSLLFLWLQDQDWRKRHATLICLAQIAEGCSKVMMKQLDPLVDMCVKGLADPHPKVRWAACQALGQMCTDLGPGIQDLAHGKILPSLMAVMDDFNNPRVQAHASAAVVNFSENCEQTLLPPYLDTLIGKLLLLLQHGKKLVQEGALTAMASVADCSQTLFVEYYDRVMPLLYNILILATDKPHRLLRAKALECISLVGMAVGRDRFSQDAHKVMMFLQQLQVTAMDADDPTGSYMLQAGARLCKCLGDQFLPYLSIVMPPLLKSAMLEPDIKVRGDDEEDVEEEDDDEDLERIPIGDKIITIRTSCLEEKSTACNMLCCYAGELKEGFFPYVKQVTDIMVPLLKFWFHEDVRRAAVQSLGELLHSAVLTVEKGVTPGVDMNYIKQMLEFMWPPLLEALTKEPEVDVQCNMLQTVAEIIEMVDKRLIQQEWVATAFECFKGCLKTSEERRTERTERQAGEDFDEEELEVLEQENETEEELFDQVGTCVGAFLKKFGDDVLPYVEALMPQIAPLLDKKRNSEERRIAVCIVDDLLEHSPAGRAKYAEQLLPMLLVAVADDYPDLRQCAAYGVGVLASQAPQVVRPGLAQVLQVLLAVVQHPEARSSDNETATDNAASALGKLLEHCGDGAEGPTIAAAWLASLPLTADAVEAVESHALLARLLVARDARLMGAAGGNLGHVVKVLVTVLAHGVELASAETGQGIVGLLHEMQASLPAEAVQQTLASLTPAQQTNFQLYMSGTVPPASA